MVDSQEGLLGGSANATARTAGLIVVGAVLGLFLLRRFNISASVG